MPRVRRCERIPASSGAGRAVGTVQHLPAIVGPDFVRNRFDVARRTRECYGIGEMPAPNHKRWRTCGGSHGDDTDSDGASLTGPQPYTGEETRVPPVCCRFPLSAGWNLERHARRKSDGRIPRPSGRGGGQGASCFDDARYSTRMGVHTARSLHRRVVGPSQPSFSNAALQIRKASASGSYGRLRLP